MTDTVVRCAFCGNFGTVSKETYKCSECGGTTEPQKASPLPPHRPKMGWGTYSSTYLANPYAATYGIWPFDEEPRGGGY